MTVDEIEIFSIPFILKHKYNTLFRIVKFELGSLSVLVRTQVWIFITKVKLPCNTHILRGRADVVVVGTSLNERVSAFVIAFQGALFAWLEINVRYC